MPRGIPKNGKRKYNRKETPLIVQGRGEGERPMNKDGVALEVLSKCSAAIETIAIAVNAITQR